MHGVHFCSVIPMQRLKTTWNLTRPNYMSLSLLCHQATCVLSLTITLSLKVHSISQGSLVTSSNSMLLYLLGIRMQYINKTIIVPLPEVGKKGGGRMREKNQNITQHQKNKILTQHQNRRSGFLPVPFWHTSLLIKKNF